MLILKKLELNMNFVLDSVLRQATPEDIPGMHRVRLAVSENALRSTVINEASYLPAINETGRGWVVEVAGDIVAFAVGNRETGNIWALFVDPKHEACGYGRRLHETMIAYLFGCGVVKLNLSTASGTRAEKFYAALGWQLATQQKEGETFFEMWKPN
jgi:GNAT superfamily N-acetyltransferase